MSRRLFVVMSTVAVIPGRRENSSDPFVNLFPSGVMRTSKAQTPSTAAFGTASLVPHPATKAVAIVGLAATAYMCSGGNSTNGNTPIG